MESKHTKGKWELRSDLPYSTGGWKVFTGRGEKNRTIVHLPYGCKVPQPKDKGYLENEANAKLIVAAPKLLEFAIEIARSYTNNPWLCEQANKLIKKATE